MNLRDLVTHSGRLRATWVTRCAASHDWLPQIGFDCLHLHALGDQPVQLIRFASLTELTGMDLRDLATHSGRLGATWAIHQRSLARLVGSYWLRLARSGCPGRPASAASSLPARLSESIWVLTKTPTLSFSITCFVHASTFCLHRFLIHRL